MENYQLTLTGKTFGEVVQGAMSFVEQFSGTTLVGVKTKPTTTKTTTKKAAAPAQEEKESDDLLDMEGNEEVTEVEEAVEDLLGEEEPMDEESEEPEEKPAAKKVAAKVKITDKQVIAAAKAHATAHGKKKTLAILDKKFGVQSVIELDPDQYPAVMKALTA